VSPRVASSRDGDGLGGHSGRHRRRWLQPDDLFDENPDLFGVIAPRAAQWQRSNQRTPRQVCPTWSAPIIPAARLRRLAKAPQVGGVFQEIGGAGNAFGGLGHPGGDLTGSSDVLRGENGAQVRDQ
jgi:hypothetical protein